MGTRYGAVAQLGERLQWHCEGQGSIPLGSTIKPLQDFAEHIRAVK